MHRMIVLHARNVAEQHFLLARMTGAVIRKDENVRRIRNNHLVPQHANAERAGQILALIKHRLLIRLARSLGVFQNDDPIPFFSQARPPAIIHAFTNPHAAHRIHIDVGGLQKHRFSRKNGNLQTGRHLQQLDGLIRCQLPAGGKTHHRENRRSEDGVDGFMNQGAYCNLKRHEKSFTLK